MLAAVADVMQLATQGSVPLLGGARLAQPCRWVDRVWSGRHSKLAVLQVQMTAHVRLRAPLCSWVLPLLLTSAQHWGTCIPCCGNWVWLCGLPLPGCVGTSKCPLEARLSVGAGRCKPTLNHLWLCWVKT